MLKPLWKKNAKESQKIMWLFLNLSWALFLCTSLRSYEMVHLVQAPLLVTWKLVAPVTTKSPKVSQLMYVLIFSEKGNDTYREKSAATNVH